MAVYNRFLMTVGSVFFVTTFLLAALGSQQWALYFTFYLIEYLSLGLLFTAISHEARKVLDGLGYVLLPAFGIIGALKVVEIVFGLPL